MVLKLDGNQLPNMQPRAAAPAPAAQPAAPTIASDTFSFGAPGAPLPPEQAALVKQGLLPANFGELVRVQQAEGLEAAKALVRQGKQGPFSRDYGDPDKMLAGARQVAQHPELQRLMKDLRKGDLLCVAYNSTTDIIANATHGPFGHVLMCAQDGPPPEFIEAIGMTGDQSDPSCNHVRRSMSMEELSQWSSYRIVRPTAGMPAPQRAKAIDAAVKFCEQQLGKPYDYTFGETTPGASFYCSSLGYFAYTEGAKIPVPMQKTAQRDALMLALDSMVDAMAPKDRARLMDEIARKVNSRPAPSPEELTSFVVQRVLPECNATAKLAATPADKAKLQAAIDTFRTGKGLPRYQAAARTLHEGDKAGRYGTPVIGDAKRLWDRAKIGGAAASDVYHAFDGTGMSPLQTASASTHLLAAFLPYSEATSAFIFGKQDSRTQFFGKLLDTTDWLRTHRPTSWVSGGLPVRGTNAVDGRFISPTDLAWTHVYHNDYNVRPSSHLDQVRA